MCQFQLKKAWPTCHHSERLILCVCQQRGVASLSVTVKCVSQPAALCLGLLESSMASLSCWMKSERYRLRSCQMFNSLSMCFLQPSSDSLHADKQTHTHRVHLKGGI